MEILKNSTDARLQIDCMEIVSITRVEHGRNTGLEAKWPTFAIVPFPAINAFPHRQQKIINLD